MGVQPEDILDYMYHAFLELLLKSCPIRKLSMCRYADAGKHFVSFTKF